MCRLWHQALAWLCVVLLPKPGLSAGSSSAFDTPAPPPPVIDMFADCPQGGCKRMVVTRKDYRECEPVRLRLVGKPMCVEAGQQITYPPCLEDQGCLSLYCPSQTDWPLVCPVADSIRSHKDKGSNLVSFTLFDDTKAVLGQCPRRRHFGFYTVFDEEDIRSGTGGRLTIRSDWLSLIELGWQVSCGIYSTRTHSPSHVKGTHCLRAPFSARASEESFIFTGSVTALNFKCNTTGTTSQLMLSLWADRWQNTLLKL